MAKKTFIKTCEGCHNYGQLLKASNERLKHSENQRQALVVHIEKVEKSIDKNVIIIADKAKASPMDVGMVSDALNELSSLIRGSESKQQRDGGNIKEGN